MLKFYADLYEILENMHGLIKKSIRGLSQESLDWKPGHEMNSICTLTVHITGAESYWINDVIGLGHSNREREKEFLANQLNQEELFRLLDETLEKSRMVLDTLEMSDVDLIRISPRDGRAFSTTWCLLHAIEHTALHLGQVQITRQLLEQHNQQ